MIAENIRNEYIDCIEELKVDVKNHSGFNVIQMNTRSISNYSRFDDIKIILSKFQVGS